MLTMSREFLATSIFIVLMSSEDKTCHQDLRWWVLRTLSLLAFAFIVMIAHKAFPSHHNTCTPSVPKLLSNLCSNNEIKLKFFFSILNSSERSSRFSTNRRQTTSMSWSKPLWIPLMQWATTSWRMCSCRTVPYQGHEMWRWKQLQTSPHGQGEDVLTGPSPGHHCLSIGTLQQHTQAFEHGLITTGQYKWDAKNRELDNIFGTEGVFVNANFQVVECTVGERRVDDELQ
jgi:hypothetical protein